MSNSDRTLEERVIALETRELTLADLPMGKLKRKLEKTMSANADDLLEPGTVTVDMLGNSALYQFNVTWPGGSTVSNIITVPHGFGTLPRLAFAEVQDQTSIGPNKAYIVAKFTGTIQVRVQTLGASPATPSSGVLTPTTMWVIA